MNSKTIEKWQAKKISESLFPGINYLVRLRDRMQCLGCPPDDELFREVCAAYDATCRLYGTMQRLSCGIDSPVARAHDLPIEQADDMCGRFVRYASWAELRQSLRLLTIVELPPSYNIAPTQQVLVAREHDGRREGVAMRWGLIPSWAKDAKKPQINARGETVAEKPMFRSAFKNRRCLILANGYYEWKTLGPKQKQPYLLRLKNDEPFTFAGIWETWKGDGDAIDSCSIITTKANEFSRPIHDRMPVILRSADADAWLDPAIVDAKALVPLLRPLPAGEMVAFPVSARVNKVSENDAGLIEIEK